MKQITLILTLLFVTLAAQAQESSKAKAILDRAYNAYTASEGIKLSFKLYVTDSNGDAYRPETGTAMVKGDKFRITTNSVDTWFDGKTQWVLIKDVNEVNITNPTNEEVATISPLALLGMYKNGYTLRNPVSKTINGKSAHVIEMIPAKSNKEFVSVSVAIDKKSNTILQVNLKLKNGMTNKIDITKYIDNYKFANSDFVFDKNKHKGVEIIDLR